MYKGFKIENKKLIHDRELLKYLKPEEIEPATEIIEILNNYIFYSIVREYNLYNIMDEEDLDLILKILLINDWYQIDKILKNNNILELWENINETDLYYITDIDDIEAEIDEIYEIPENLICHVDYFSIIRDLDYGGDIEEYGIGKIKKDSLQEAQVILWYYNISDFMDQLNI